MESKWRRHLSRRKFNKAAILIQFLLGAGLIDELLKPKKKAWEIHCPQKGLEDIIWEGRTTYYSPSKDEIRIGTAYLRALSRPGRSDRPSLGDIRGVSSTWREIRQSIIKRIPPLIKQQSSGWKARTMALPLATWITNNGRIRVRQWPKSLRGLKWCFQFFAESKHQ